MRVVLKTDYATLHGRAKRAGEVIDLPAADAGRLVAAGLAKAMAAPLEAAVRAAPAERAIRRGRRP